MLVFVVETITGGGALGAELPASLIAEGALMRDTLIGDLEDLPGVRVITTHDARFPAPPRGTSTALRLGDDPRSIWRLMAQEADCCWPIAPESGGLLEGLVREFRAHCRRVVAPEAETIALCASKSRTARALAAAGVNVVPTGALDALPEGTDGPFVVKPDDGAGGFGLRLLDHRPTPPLPAGHVVQPFIEGEAASLTLLCQSGRTHVLTANRQHIARENGTLRFTGVTVGAFPVDDALRAFAESISAALPGLHGLVGVDYIATVQGSVAIEVNPRLTTSYAGLRRALAVNPLAFMAEFIRDGVVPDLPHLPPALPVEVLL
ncbi:putative ATP-grasp superfamily ATP-dependent carboligase [Ancylobacter aquaticus]|uniref:Putative ATP-grasp superfamily ATP-dependent carboligase n=1 Tax=Ancylobacter aquaticus TaxID=100 RepID=A0A4R1IDB6_ANCAQ|nr:ATP-grasp domain-containing protein [Ancylobacter aquaticus]TCK31329.1 putative ATP-grasp superfamily ATP-dependent carboligase [Ancylobacter aquaticus]